MGYKHLNNGSWQLCTVTLLILQYCISSSIAFTLQLREECNEITANSKCQCSPILTDLEISCPALNPKIAVRIHPDIHVQIECYQIDTNDYSLIPQMKIGNNPMVHIKQCPLPGHSPISRILDQLGITQVNSLIIESNNLDINLTRHHLSGLQNLGRLRLSSKDISHLPEDLFSDMRNLTWLDFRCNKKYLPVNIFSSLENLNFLELGHNNMEYLPPGIFKNQRKLSHLNLWGNQLTNLTKDVFIGVSSIAELDLSANGIETFEPDVFALLTNLSNINLNANNFKELPVGLFAKNHNLTQFRLKNNRVPLKKLPEGLLANMPGLKDIRLTCDLEMIPGNIFANSSSITNISITENNLATLPGDLLADQYNLLDLDLCRNNLQTLPDTLFLATKNLMVLKLSENQLTEISSDLFATLTNLDALYMDNNHLKIIHPNAFVATQNIRLIDMKNNEIDFNRLNELVDGNQIQNLASPFNALFKLEVLNLRNNSVMYIFQDWKFNLLKLQRLDLSYNNISTLSDDDLQFLSSSSVDINLIHNQLRTVNFNTINDQGASQTGGLIRMDLGNNPIDCNCILLKFVQFLRQEEGKALVNTVNINADHLVCENPPNLRGRLVKKLSPMELLCPLDNANSTTKHCPRECECWVRPYDSVLMINCSNSNMTKVPNLPRLETFNGNLRSTELHIENNTIRTLPQSKTPGYSDVTKIYAARNNLTKLEANNLPKALTHMDLRYNQLHYLNSSALYFFNDSRLLHTLKLSQNPWECTCNAKHLLLFSQRNPRVKDFKEMRCKLPEGGWKSFAELTTNDICPVEMGLVIAVAVVISLIGFLLGLTAALYYKYEPEIKVFCYHHKIFLWFVTEEELDKDKKFDGFISYSHKDEDFVADELVRELEKGPFPYKLCIHARDWIVGECIPEQIVRSVDESRRTIVVLSQNFIESIWARMEFRTAHQAALTEKRVRVIVIIYGDIDIEKLDDELRAYLKMNTYVKWGDPWFWKKLYYAMPHRNNKKLNGLVKTPLKGSTDDKLELIKPSPVTPPLTTPPSETTKNPLVAHLNGGTPQTAVMMPNCKIGLPSYYTNGKSSNGHINGAFIINTNAKQSDV